MSLLQRLFQHKIHERRPKKKMMIKGPGVAECDPTGDATKNLAWPIKHKSPEK